MAKLKKKKKRKESSRLKLYSGPEGGPELVDDLGSLDSQWKPFSTPENFSFA